MVISGYILDIQPKQSHPTLALYFDAKHRSAIPQGNREAITLDLNGIRYYATLNSTNVNNAPYLLNSFARQDGTKCVCTECS